MPSQWLQRFALRNALATLVVLAIPTSGASASSIVGYWKLGGSPTAAVMHVQAQHRVRGKLPPPIWGWTPRYLGRVSRPGGCYTRLGSLWWVVGSGGGGAFQHYVGNCRRTDRLNSRWSLRDVGTRLQQTYVLDPDGARGPRPGRQIRLNWYRTHPSIRFDGFSYETSHLTLRLSLEAVSGVVLELRRDNGLVYARSLPPGDGSFALTIGQSMPPGRYTLTLTARSDATEELVIIKDFTAG